MAIYQTKGHKYWMYLKLFPFVKRKVTLVNYTSLNKSNWLCNTATDQSESRIPDSCVPIIYKKRIISLPLSCSLTETLPLFSSVLYYCRSIELLKQKQRASAAIKSSSSLPDYQHLSNPDNRFTAHNNLRSAHIVHTHVLKTAAQCWSLDRIISQILQF